MKVSIYKNKLDTTSQYTITVAQALERIKTGKSKELVEKLRSMDKPEYNLAKGDLPSVTFSGVFSKRTDKDLVSHSGFVCLDFDNAPDTLKMISELSKDEYIYACWLSPSGTGVKALVKVPAENENHRRYYEALLEKYPEADRSCINESRFCYESYDPNIYINEGSKVFTKFIEKKKVEISVSKPLNDEQKIFDRLITWLYNKSKYFESGNRNSFIFTLASAMCRTGVDRSTAESLILTKYDISRDFGRDEMMAAIESGYKRNANLAGSQKFEDEESFSSMVDIKGEIEYFEENFDLSDVIFGDTEGVLDVYDNGYDSADTTHFDKIDPHFKWKKGDITLFSGIGNHGKSSFVLQLMLIKSIFNGDKWAMYVPENMPAKLFYSELTEMLIGCSIEPTNPKRPHRSTIEQIQEWLQEHFMVIHPIKQRGTPEYIKSKFLGLIMKYGVSGVLIDPFNKLFRDYKEYGDRDDRFLEVFLADISNFAKHHDIYCIIIAHPTKLHKNLEDSDYQCPTVFNVAGGAMWNNGMDNIGFVHRPYKISQPDNPLCEFSMAKIRWKKIVGQEGTVQMMYDFKKRRFYIDNHNPLETNPFNFNREEVSFQTVVEKISIKKDSTNPYEMSQPEHFDLILSVFGEENRIDKKDFTKKLKLNMTKFNYPISKTSIYREFYLENDYICEDGKDYVLAVRPAPF